MGFLKFLEGIRTPFLDAFFSAVTHLGEETFFLVIGIVFFWCISKKYGYYILSVGFLGIIINQFLKLFFRVPRPWIKDPEFTIVESARKEATGYSFPSGHTQSSVGIFGAIAKIFNNKIIRTVSIVLCILVPLSRMYLGVHTPADVIVSCIVALVLIFVMYPLINKALKTKNGMRFFFLGIAILSALFLAYTMLYRFPADVDVVNLENGRANAYKMLGCILGLWISFEIDNKYLHFDTKSVWWVQILKLVLGFIPLLVIKSALKTPLIALFGNAALAGFFRYFLIAVFIGCIWPLTFPLFNKLGKGK